MIATDAAELANGLHRKGADRAGSFWVAKEASSIAVATEVQEALCRMRPDPQEVTCRCAVRQSHWWVVGELALAEHHKGDAGMAIIVALNAPCSSCRVVSLRDRHSVILCRPTSPSIRATLSRSRWKLCIWEFAKQTYQTMAMTAPVQLHSGCGLSARGFGSEAERGGGLFSGCCPQLLGAVYPGNPLQLRSLRLVGGRGFYLSYISRLYHRIPHHESLESLVERGRGCWEV